MVTAGSSRESWHGTGHGYSYHGCRCQPCTDAHRRRCNDWMNRVALKVPEADLTHGVRSTYNNYGCRCEDCRRAQSDHNRQWRERRKAAGGAS